MKILHLPAKSKMDLSFLKKNTLNLRFGLVSSMQFSDRLKEVQKYFKKSVIGGQVLGCDAKNAEKIKNKVDAFLFIGTGKFHPIEIALKTGKDVYIANPYDKNIHKLDKIEIEELIKLKTISYKNYLMADTVGILVSTKPGQENLKEAIKLKNKIKKKSYIFISDEIRFDEFENFPEIKAWVNTACPRIEHKKVVNLGDIKERFKYIPS